MSLPRAATLLCTRNLAAALVVSIVSLVALAIPSTALADQEAVSKSPDYELSINHISGRYIPAGLFKRISEYFTGVENKDGKIIERSQPDSRGGYYLIVTLDLFSNSFPENSVFVVEYIHSDNRRPQMQIFPLLEPHPCAREAFLGLTGDDWPSPDRTMVAWKVSILAPNGKLIAEPQSYLWDLPKKDAD